jgi:lysophospholipase L1-like esterase
VYTIFGSLNDYEYSQTHSIPIGTATDTGTNTLCGYFNSTISALVSRNPLINIGIVSPCPWVSVNEYNGAGNGFGKEYSDALKAVAARWSIPFLDLYECSGLRPWNSAFVAAAYTKDSLAGVHPDETGHKILATKFKEFLSELLP